MAGIQIGVVAYAAQQAGTAARAGARAASLRQDADQACKAAVSGFLADGTSCPDPAYGDKEVTVTATVHIPKVLWDFGNATKTATMPLDH